MTLAIMGAADTGQVSTAANISYYMNTCGRASAQNASGSEVAYVTMREAGNLQNLLIRMITNGVSGGTSTFVQRDNSTTVTQNVSIAPSATGEFEDTINQDTIVAGHKYDLLFTPGATTGTVALENIRTHFNTTTNTATRLCLVGGASGFAFTGSSTTYYQPIHGNGFNSTQTSEANMKCRQRLAGTLQNMFVVVTGNTRTIAITVNSRIDTGSGSANGNLTMSITALTSGVFEDVVGVTGHTDTVAAGNDINTALTVGSDTSKSITFFGLGLSFISTAGYTYCCCAASPGSLPNTTTTKYYPLSGTMLAASAAESTTAAMKAGEQKRFSQMNLFLSANSTGTGTMNFRKNAANGSMTVSVTASATGNFTDTTNVDYVVATDQINYSFTPGAASGVTMQATSSWALKFAKYGMTENTSISDGAARKLTAIRAASDTTAISDTGSPTRKAMPKIAAETSAVGDLLKRKALPKMAAELVAIGDLLKRKVLPKIAAETVPSSDSILKVKGRYYTLAAQTVPVSDHLVRKPLPKIVAQSVPVGDGIVRLAHFFRSVTDKIPAADGSGYTSGYTSGFMSIPGLVRKVMPKIAAETVTVSAGSVTRTARFVRSVSDTKSITDLLVRKAIPKMLAQTVSVGDLLNRKAIPKLLTQTIPVSDGLVKVAHFFRSVSDTKSITDLLARTARPKMATQTVTVNDLQPVRKAKPKMASETVGISDSIVKHKRFVRAVSDTVVVGVELLKRKAIPLIATELVSISENLTKIAHGLKTISVSDTVLIGELISRKVSRKPIVESIPSLDLLNRKVMHTIVDPLVANFYEALYIYPNWWVGTPWSWTPVINAAAANPTVKFFVVVNVNSGPDVAVNGDYTAGLSQLQANSNVVVLGYVATQYGVKTLANVQSEIDRWASFYPTINGIMLDEMDNVTGHESYYSSITAYAHSHSGVNFQYVFGNPGNPTITSYVGTVDVILIFENVGPPPNEATLQTRTFNHAYSPKQFGMVVHDQATDPGRDYTIMASKYVGYIFYTDGTGANPYSTVPSYLSSELTDFYPGYVVKDSILRKVVRSLLQTVPVGDSLVRLAHFFRAVSELSLISDLLARKAKPKISTETIPSSDSLGRKIILKVTDSIATVSGSLKRTAKPKISAQTVPVSEQLGKFIHYFRTITDSTGISDSIHLGVNRFYSFVMTETVALSDHIQRKVVRRKVELPTIPISDSVAKSTKRIRNQSDTINISDQLRAVATFFTKPIIRSTGAGYGFAGGGERVNRPIPSTAFLKDWTMSWRKRVTRKFKT